MQLVTFIEGFGGFDEVQVVQLVGSSFERVRMSIGEWSNF